MLDTPQFQIGRTGEKMVAELLRERGWYVIPSYDYSGEDGKKAPRMEGQRAAYVIPDLDIAKDGTRRWAEVKTKTGATYTRITQRYEHGIPLRHFRDYFATQEITGCEVWLFVLEQDTGDVLCGKLNELAQGCREYHGDQMSRGGMVFFPREAFGLFTTLATIQTNTDKPVPRCI